MKVKHIIATLGLAAVMGLGVGAGLSFGSEVKEAEASITTYGYEIRYTKTWSAGDPVIYTWDGKGTEAYYNMIFIFNNDYSQPIYSWTPTALEPLYENLIIKANDTWDHKTSDQTSPTTPGVYNYYGEFNSTGCVEISKMKFYLYDYDGAFSGGAVYAHVTRSGASSLVFDDGLGLQMTAENNLSGNGRVYSVEVSNAADRVTFQNSAKNISVTPENNISGNFAYVYAPESVVAGESTWWDNINYVYAHNWAMNLLNFRTYSAASGAGVNSGTCESNYSTAKSVYNYCKANNKYVLREISSSFHDSLDRMVHWAEHNGEEFSYENSTLDEVNYDLGTFVPRAQVLSNTLSENSNNTAIIIAIVAGAALLAIGGYFVIRRRKED